MMGKIFSFCGQYIIILTTIPLHLYIILLFSLIYYFALRAYWSLLLHVI